MRTWGVEHEGATGLTVSSAACLCATLSLKRLGPGVSTSPSSSRLSNRLHEFFLSALGSGGSCLPMIQVPRSRAGSPLKAASLSDSARLTAHTRIATHRIKMPGRAQSIGVKCSPWVTTHERITGVLDARDTGASGGCAAPRVTKAVANCRTEEPTVVGVLEAGGAEWSVETSKGLHPPKLGPEELPQRSLRGSPPR